MTQHDALVAVRHMSDHAEEAVALAAGRSRNDLDTDRVFSLAPTRLVEIKELARGLQERMMGKTETSAWDPVEHLESEDDMVTYLEAAFEEDDPALIGAALRDIARAKGDDVGGARRRTRPGKSLQGNVSQREPGVRHRAEGRQGPRTETPCESWLKQCPSRRSAIVEG